MNRQKLCYIAAIAVLVLGASPFVFKTLRGGIRGLAKVNDSLEEDKYNLFQYLVDKGAVKIEEDTTNPERFWVVVNYDREHRLDDNHSEDSEKTYDPEIVFSALQVWIRAKRDDPFFCETQIWIRRTSTYPETVMITIKDLQRAKSRNNYANGNLGVTADGCKTASMISTTIRGLRPELGVNDCWNTVVNSQETLRFASHRMPLAFHDEFQLEVLFAVTPEAVPEY
jgi:hypothetical protein